MNGGVVGVFIAPTTKLDRWWRLSVRWRIGQSGAPATSPVPLESDRWSSDFWARLDVWWRTGHALFTVRCASMGVSATCALWRAFNAVAGSRWREVAVAPLLHRTVRCTPDMSGAPATSPKSLGFDRWSSDFWARLDVQWRTRHVLFNVQCASMGVPDNCARSARI